MPGVFVPRLVNENDHQLILAGVRFWLPAPMVDATQALNLSAGVANPKVLRGRSLSWRLS
jgi:hypothetical protein